jgi:hypothetical protein
MRSPPKPQAEGVFMPPARAKVYLAKGWSVADHSTPHSMLIVPCAPRGDAPRRCASSWAAMKSPAYNASEAALFTLMTLSRAERGQPIAIESYLRVVEFIGVPPESFLSFTETPTAPP